MEFNTLWGGIPKQEEDEVPKDEVIPEADKPELDGEGNPVVPEEKKEEDKPEAVVPEEEKEDLEKKVEDETPPETGLIIKISFFCSNLFFIPSQDSKIINEKYIN